MFAGSNGRKSDVVSLGDHYFAPLFEFECSFVESKRTPRHVWSEVMAPVVSDLCFA